MRTQSLHHYTERSSFLSASAHHESEEQGNAYAGVISELVYSEHQPMLSLLLLPLLRQLGKQSRWLLWLNPQHRLSKQWLADSGLPASKVMQLNQIEPVDSIYAMECALRSGNYSVVLGWLPPLTQNERARLRKAAQDGECFGLVMQPDLNSEPEQGQRNLLKIQSKLFH